MHIRNIFTWISCPFFLTTKLEVNNWLKILSRNCKKALVTQQEIKKKKACISWCKKNMLSLISFALLFKNYPTKIKSKSLVLINYLFIKYSNYYNAFHSSHTVYRKDRKLAVLPLWELRINNNKHATCPASWFYTQLIYPNIKVSKRNSVQTQSISAFLYFQDKIHKHNRPPFTVVLEVTKMLRHN